MPTAVKDPQRSRITNGSDFLPGIVDRRRNAWIRRCKDIVAEYITALGGIENTSPQELSIVRRVAALQTELEKLEAKFAQAGEGETNIEALDLYQRTAGNLRRLLLAIGLQRRARDVSIPSLSEYLRTHHTIEEDAV
jgi:uncharacterized small protein (DUF1192 family)